jgi:hypothetical protein
MSPWSIEVPRCPGALDQGADIGVDHPGRRRYVTVNTEGSERDRINSCLKEVRAGPPSADDNGDQRDERGA